MVSGTQLHWDIIQNHQSTAHSIPSTPLLTVELQAPLQSNMSAVSFFFIFLLIVHFCSCTSSESVECPKCETVITPSQVDKSPNIITTTLTSGCTVKLMKGKYVLTDHITFHKGGCLVGAGIDDDGTILSVSESKKKGFKDGVVRVSSDMVTMKNFSLDISVCKSSDFCKYAAKVIDSTNLLIENVNLRGGNSDTGSYTTFSNFFIQLTYLLQVFITNSKQITLRDLSLSHAFRSCLNVKSSSAIHMEGCTAYHCNYHGFSFEGCSGISVKTSVAQNVGYKIPTSDGGERQLHGSGAHFKNSGASISVTDFIVQNAHHAGIWMEDNCLKVKNLKVFETEKGPCILLRENAKVEYKDISCPSEKLFGIEGKVYSKIDKSDCDSE